MTNEPIAAGGPTPPAAEDRDDLTPLEIQELGRDVVDRAIARYRECEARMKRAGELADLDNRLDRWCELETSMFHEATRDLVRAVLATSPASKIHSWQNAQRYRWPAVGVASGGQVYLAIGDPYQAEAPEAGNGPDLMMLAIVDRAAIVDLEAIRPETYAPAKRPG